ncbi:DUF4886 domain-containing protein [Gemmatimonadota bacterium]
MNIKHPKVSSCGTLLLLAGLLLLAVGNLNGCSTSPTGPGGDDLKILFVGNSLTYWNDMPETLRRLARSAGKKVWVADASEPGATLTDHTHYTSTMKQINRHNWDYIILQSGNARVAFPSTQPELYPTYELLKEYIEQCCPDTKIVMFLDWSPDGGINTTAGRLDYFAFQQMLHDGTRFLAARYGFMIAPVGWGWRQVREERPEIDLVGLDAIHPSRVGSYLQACIYFASIFLESPVGLDHTGAVLTPIARYLQEVAAEVVLTDPAHWFLTEADRSRF